MTMPDGSAAPGCPHPFDKRDRDIEEGVTFCGACGATLAEPDGIVVRQRPGSDPTNREGQNVGGLRKITWDPEAPNLSRPYTSVEVEMEMVDTIDRIERGAGWLTTQEEARAAAKLKWDLANARALYDSQEGAADRRKADALLRTRDLYEDWQRLELVCKTAREGLHNLRAKADTLRSIGASVRTVMENAR